MLLSSKTATQKINKKQAICCFVGCEKGRKKKSAIRSAPVLRLMIEMWDHMHTMLSVAACTCLHHNKWNNSVSNFSYFFFALCLFSCNMHQNFAIKTKRIHAQVTSLHYAQKDLCNHYYLLAQNNRRSSVSYLLQKKKNQQNLTIFWMNYYYYCCERKLFLPWFQNIEH